MTGEEVLHIKALIKGVVKRRNGEGDISYLAGPEYDLTEDEIKNPYATSVGEKTVDILLSIVGREEDREFFKELGTGPRYGSEIPSAFNVADIERICKILNDDLEDPNRGTPKEVNHCNGSCTGICKGSCSGTSMSFDTFSMNE